MKIERVQVRLKEVRSIFIRGGDATNHLGSRLDKFDGR
jgi:hypothetical protein